MREFPSVCWQKLVEEQEQRLCLGTLQFAIRRRSGAQDTRGDFRDLGQGVAPLRPDPSMDFVCQVDGRRLQPLWRISAPSSRCLPYIRRRQRTHHRPTMLLEHAEEQGV